MNKDLSHYRPSIERMISATPRISIIMLLTGIEAEGLKCPYGAKWNRRYVKQLLTDLEINIVRKLKQTPGTSFLPVRYETLPLIDLTYAVPFGCRQSRFQPLWDAVKNLADGQAIVVEASPTSLSGFFRERQSKEKTDWRATIRKLADGRYAITREALDPPLAA